MMMTMMMKLPILPCAEELELVLSTAPKKHEITPTKTVKKTVLFFTIGINDPEGFGKRKNYQGRRNRGPGGPGPQLKVRGHIVCLAPSLFVPEQLMHCSSWTDS